MSGVTPLSLEELRLLPPCTSSVSLRGIVDMSEDAIALIPPHVTHIDLSGATWIHSLTHFTGLVNLKRLDCLCCPNLNFDDVMSFKTMRPDVKLDLWGCWHLGKFEWSETRPFKIEFKSAAFV